MPIYLKSIGFSIILIGILEGFAEAIAGLSKGYFGKLSDASSRRVPFVQIGYSLSAISKPLMALFSYPFWIFFVRTIDRLGKGVRTAARDTILSTEASIETKAKVFGFHRSMDTFGAVLGPSLALIYLHFYPEDYKTLFYIAFIPGILAVVSSLYLKEKLVTTTSQNKKISFFSFLSYWKESPLQYKKVVLGFLVFALFNSSDIFLLLQAKQSGLNDSEVIGIYIFYNLIYALFAFPVGMIADKIGIKPVFIIGLILFVLVYLGMAYIANYYLFYFIFFLYGLYASATEGISKAWISNVIHKEKMATALGTFSGFQSICAMLASTLTGMIWFHFGSSVAFIITALVTTFVIFYFIILPYSTDNSN